MTDRKQAAPAPRGQIVSYRERFNGVRDFIEARRDQVGLALPKDVPLDRFLRVVYTAVQRTPKLLDCTQSSLWVALMETAQLGLLPDPITGEAALIPRKNKNRGNVLEANFQIMYRGLLSLIRRSGQIQAFDSRLVFEGDDFEISLGTDPMIRHVPKFGRPRVVGIDGAGILGAYAVARFKDGTTQFDYMTRDEINEIRSRSVASHSGPWVTDWGEMARKTVAKRLGKYLPIAIEIQRVITLDDLADRGLGQPAEVGEMPRVDGISVDEMDSTPEDVSPPEADPPEATAKDVSEVIRRAKGAQDPPRDDGSPPPDDDQDPTPPTGRGKGRKAAKTAETQPANSEPPHPAETDQKLVDDQPGREALLPESTIPRSWVAKAVKELGQIAGKESLGMDVLGAVQAEVLGSHGFEHWGQVTVEAYDRVCLEIAQGLSDKGAAKRLKKAAGDEAPKEGRLI